MTRGAAAPPVNAKRSPRVKGQPPAIEGLHDLAHYAEERGKQEGFVVRTTLWRDFAPLSFRFTHEITRDGETWESWLSGGLIYEGPDVPADGSFPSLTVSVGSNGKPGWGVHT